MHSRSHGYKTKRVQEAEVGKENAKSPIPHKQYSTSLYPFIQIPTPSSPQKKSSTNLYAHPLHPAKIISPPPRTIIPAIANRLFPERPGMEFGGGPHTINFFLVRGSS